MYKISTLNKISPAGLARFTDAYEIADGTNGIDGSEFSYAVRLCTI